MKRGSKRGQLFDMSFNMIFSIIIIIAILAVGFYVIYNAFFPALRCAKTAMFYQPLEEDIKKAWQSTISKEAIEFAVPAGISRVCFGSLSSAMPEYREITDALPYELTHNVFLYPPEKSCDVSSSSKIIKHVRINGFFCVSAVKDKIRIKLEKNSLDELVTISP